jgi:hypothetical protein
LKIENWKLKKPGYLFSIFNFQFSIYTMKTPPGPRSYLPGRFLRAMQRDPIPFFTKLARDYGDAAQFRIGPQVIILFNHPDLVRDLLVTQDRSFDKSRVLQRRGVTVRVERRN